MAANFDTDQVSNYLGSKFQKTILLGATARELSDLATLAIKENRPKKILLSVDIQSFRGTANRTGTDYSLIQKLYNSPITATIYYSLNIDFLKIAVKQFSTSHKVSNYFSYDRDHGKELALKDWNLRKKTSQQSKVNRLKDTYSYDLLTDSINLNLIDLLKKNPNIEFILFFPPYSILEWLSYKENLHLSEYLKAREHIASQILPIKNVRLFDFSSDVSFITNLDNYSDIMHFGAVKSSEILRYILQNQGNINSIEQIRSNNEIISNAVLLAEKKYTHIDGTHNTLSLDNQTSYTLTQ